MEIYSLKLNKSKFEHEIELIHEVKMPSIKLIDVAIFTNEQKVTVLYMDCRKPNVFIYDYHSREARLTRLDNEWTSFTLNTDHSILFLVDCND